MEPRFDVYITGTLLDGFEENTVIDALAGLFSLEKRAASALLGGAERRVKSDCDKATALKYRQAISAIGAGVTISRHDEAPFASADSMSRSPLDGDQTVDDNSVSGNAEQEKVIDPFPQAAHDAGSESASTTEPPDANTPVAQEQAPWEIAPAGSLMSAVTDTPDAPLIAVPSYEVAPPGEIIPTIERNVTAVNPVIDHLQLSPLEE